MSKIFINIQSNYFNTNNYTGYKPRNHFCKGKNVEYINVDNILNAFNISNLMFTKKPQRKVTPPQDHFQKVSERTFLSVIFTNMLASLFNDISSSKHNNSSTDSSSFKTSRGQNNTFKPRYTYTQENSYSNFHKSKPKTNYSTNYSAKTETNQQKLQDALTALDLNSKNIKDLSEADIKSAYRKQAKIWHPDKNPSPLAKEKFQKLVEHRDTLLNHLNNK